MLLQELDLKWNFIYVDKELSIQEKNTYLKMLVIFHIEITDLTVEMCEIIPENKSSCLGNFEEIKNENKFLSCLNCKGYEYKSTLNFFKFVPV